MNKWLSQYDSEAKDEQNKPSLTVLSPDGRIEEIRRISKDFQNNGLLESMVLDLLMYLANMTARRNDLLTKVERQAEQITMLEKSREAIRKENAELKIRIRKQSG